MKVYRNIFEQIISVENLFLAWDLFKGDKQKKSDVQLFERNVEQNLFQLHRTLRSKTYRHSPYTSFYVLDPKQRHIHKAEVRDRILHHAIFNILNPIFERTYIDTSFSCRVDKGTHKGVEAVTKMTRQVSRNRTRPCFVLKCDVQKFFFRIDHAILTTILKKVVRDEDALWLIGQVIDSFASIESNIFAIKGLPIGNLTSQLFANIYMNGFDHYVKHVLRVQHYARYTDDFVIVGESTAYLEGILPPIRSFLKERLDLELHPKKTFIRPLHQGIDFLGYTIFPHHRLVRTKTRRRMFRKLRQKTLQYKAGKTSEESLDQSLQSYRGVLSHADTHELTEHLENQFWHWFHE